MPVEYRGNYIAPWGMMGNISRMIFIKNYFIFPSFHANVNADSSLNFELQYLNRYLIKINDIT